MLAYAKVLCASICIVQYALQLLLQVKFCKDGMDWGGITRGDWVVHSAVPLSTVLAEVRQESLPYSSNSASLRTVIFVSPLHFATATSAARKESRLALGAGLHANSTT